MQGVKEMNKSLNKGWKFREQTGQVFKQGLRCKQNLNPKVLWKHFWDIPQ